MRPASSPAVSSTRKPHRSRRQSTDWRRAEAKRPMSRSPRRPRQLPQRSRRASRCWPFARGSNPSAYYRTFCVKLCDGSSIPMSYSTRPGNFLSDDDRCQSSCPSSPSKLFYAPTNQGVEQSVGLDSQRYSNLPNALRYKTEFVEDCRCKPEPWSKEAQIEYQRRDIVATQTSGESVVAAGITETAKIAAGGDIEIADQTETRPSAPRSKDWSRYRYSNADDGSSEWLWGQHLSLWTRRAQRLRTAQRQCPAATATAQRLFPVRIALTHLLCAARNPMSWEHHDTSPHSLRLSRQYLPLAHG